MAIKIWGTESVVRSSGDAALQDAVTLLGDGGYVVTWSEAGKIYFQRYDGLGQKDGLPVDTGATSIIAATFADVQSIGVDGGFVITWTQETGTTVKTETLLSKRFNYDGTEAGPAIQVVMAAATAAVMGSQAMVARAVAVADMTTVVVTSTLASLAGETWTRRGGGVLLNRRFGAIAMIFAGAVTGALLLRWHIAVPFALSAALTAGVAVLGHLRLSPRRAHPVGAR